MLLERDAPGDRERALQLTNDALATAQELGMKIVVEKLLATKLEIQGVQSADSTHSVYAVATVVQQQRPDLRAHAAPDGTVTLMFSDMEDFTGMTERLGDVEAHRVVQAHNGIVRDSCWRSRARARRRSAPSHCSAPSRRTTRTARRRACACASVSTPARPSRMPTSSSGRR
jgi:class 3 adenylate cyclase